MKLTLLLLLAAAACASPLSLRDSCREDDCLHGLRSAPADASLFCLDYLGRFVTATVFPTGVTTVTVNETATRYYNTVTTYYDTVTATVTPSPSQPSSIAPDPTVVSSFVRSCRAVPNYISSGCSCLLPPATTFTSTVTTTITDQATVTVTSILSRNDIDSDLVVSAVRTVEWCDPSPSPILTNGGFDTNKSSIAPWYIVPNLWQLGFRDAGAKLDILSHTHADKKNNKNYLQVTTFPTNSSGFGGTAMALDLSTATTNICLHARYTVHLSVKQSSSSTFFGVYLGDRCLFSDYSGGVRGKWNRYSFTVKLEAEEQRVLKLVMQRKWVVQGVVPAAEDHVWIDSVWIEKVVEEEDEYEGILG